MSEINIEKSIIINGDSSITIQNVDVSTGDLVVEFSNGQSFNAGYVKGEAGLGYANSYIDGDNLMLEFTDGTVQNIGNVRGETGIGVADVDVTDGNITLILDNGMPMPPFQVQKTTTEVALKPGDVMMTARDIVTSYEAWYEVNGKNPVSLYSVDNNGATNEIFEVTAAVQQPGSTYLIFEIIVVYEDGSKTTKNLELAPGENTVSDSQTGGSFILNVTYPDVAEIPQPYFRFRFGKIYSDESEWVQPPETGTRYLFDDEQPNLHPYFAEMATNKINFPSPVGPDVATQTNGSHERASFYYWENMAKMVNASTAFFAISDDLSSDVPPKFVITGQPVATEYDIKHLPELNMLITHDKWNRKICFYTGIRSEADLLDFNKSIQLGQPVGTRTPIVVSTTEVIEDIHISKDAAGNFVLCANTMDYGSGEFKTTIFDLSQDVSTFYNEPLNNIVVSSNDIEAIVGAAITKETYMGFEARPIYSQGRLYFYSETTGIYYSCTTDVTDLRTEIDFNAEGALNLYSDLLFQANGNQYNYYGQISMFDGSILLNTQTGIYMMNIENGDTVFTKLGDYNGATVKNSFVVCFNPYTNFVMLQDKRIINQLYYKATTDNGQNWYNCIPNQNPVEFYFSNGGMSARTLYINKTENSFILKTLKVSDTGITPNFNPQLSHGIFSYIESGYDSMFGIEPIPSLNSQLKTFYKS